jgi:hypothetical protein
MDSVGLAVDRERSDGIPVVAIAQFHFCSDDFVGIARELGLYTGFYPCIEG